MQDNMNLLTKLVGSNIALRRKELGLTQEALAEKVEIGQQSLSRIEHGHMAPKFERLQAFADALGWSVTDLFREKEQRDAATVDRIAKLMRGLENTQIDKILYHFEGLINVLFGKSK